MSDNILYPLPARHDYGIGIVGAGMIVNAAHLPGYRKAGLQVKALCDLNEDAARQTAQRYGVADYYTSYHPLIERRDIDIIDIAIPNEGRIEIVKAAAAAGKHILMQKPFAHRLEEALEMIAIAKAANVKLVVNQNGRYAPFYYAAKQIIDSGVLGEPYLMTHEMRINQDAYMADTWFARVPHFLTVDYDIHHIDLMRYWSGMTPERVFASSTKMPGQKFASDMTILTTMEFANGLRALLTTVDTTQNDEHFWRFSVEGTKGSLYGRIEDGYKLAKVEYYTKDNPGQWVRRSVSGDWFPDAFYGTMFELMNTINEDRESSLGGDDNVRTLKVMHSIIRSKDERTVVNVG